MTTRDEDSGKVVGSCVLRHRQMAHVDSRLRAVEKALPNFDALSETLSTLHADVRSTRAAAALAADEAAKVAAAQERLCERVEGMHADLVRQLVNAIEKRAEDADRSRDSIAQIALAERAGERDVRKEWLKIIGAVLLGLIGIASAYVAGRSHTQTSPASPAPITAPAK